MKRVLSIMSNTTPKCFGWYAECPAQVPDGVAEDGWVLYYKISCLHKFECFEEWKVNGEFLSSSNFKQLYGKSI